MVDRKKIDQRINLITLGVENLARSRDFYCDGLGWKLASPSEEQIAFIDCRGIVLALFDRRALAEDIGLNPQGEGFCGFTLAQNVSSKEEVRAVLAQAESAGAKILKPAQDVFWGGYSGYFADPDGYCWEIAWNPFFELDPQGKIVFSEGRSKR